MPRVTSNRRGYLRALKTSPFETQSQLYFNRELSLIAFYNRVLDGAEDTRRPVLERLKSVYYSVLDEFFMIRVSELKDQVSVGLDSLSVDGLTAFDQLVAIRAAVEPLLTRQQELLRTSLLPEMARDGVVVVNVDALSSHDKKKANNYFQRDVFPVLTPMAVDPAHPFPHISNLSLNLAVTLSDSQLGQRFARVKIPDVLPRFVPLSNAVSPVLGSNTTGHVRVFIPLEQLIAANITTLFPGIEVEDCYVFQVIRDADLEIAEDEASDLSLSVRQALADRRFGTAVSLFVEERTPEHVRLLLAHNLDLEPSDTYAIDGILGLQSLMELYKIDRSDLKDPPIPQRSVPGLRATEDPFATIAKMDLLLHHPFQPFVPLVDLIQSAASDPNVLAIKQTLYRVGGSHAPVVDALLAAARQGKQVAVIVELKARFDEENNIEWARALEEAGVHVTYGLVGLKTHAKLLLIVRKESDGIHRYVHIGTGNYNATTARGYTDFGYLTSNPDIGADMSELFNYLTGYSRQNVYRKLVVAPVQMRWRLMDLIERETHYGSRGQIIIKANHLVDPDIISALYSASKAGVAVDLLVRGVCCLRPGIPGLSDGIRVRSLIGRFLEHSRVYIFNNMGQPNIFLGSADVMPRNFDRRVEVLAPIEDRVLQERLISIIETYRADTAATYELQPDGVYVKLEGGSDAQASLLEFDDMLHSPGLD